MKLLTGRSRRGAVLCGTVGILIAIGAPSETAWAEPTECPTDMPPASVMEAYLDPEPSKPTGTAEETTSSRYVRMKDNLIVKVENLSSLLKDAECRKSKIVLFLDGRPLPDVAAYPPTDPAAGILRFPLERTEKSRDVWTYILGSPRWDSRATSVSVGMPDRFPIAAKATILLEVLPQRWFALWAGIFFAMLISFGMLARTSDLLRDSGAVPVGGRRPYSLARAQAAWWLFLVVASYLWIGLITGDYSTSVTATVLGLLGISAGTALGSAFVDAGKATPAAAAEQTAAEAQIKQEIVQIDADIAALGTLVASASGAAKAELDAKLAQKKADKATREAMLMKLANRSEQFIKDILSDVNGVSFHRFQIVAWTIVLGIVFIKEVYQNLAMPTFEATTLGLLGISAGTYLGLKIPEPVVPTK